MPSARPPSCGHPTAHAIPRAQRPRRSRPTSRAGSAPRSRKIVDGLAREARTADARYQALAKNFETLKKQMGAVNDQSIRLEALERDATVNRNLLEAMLLRAKQSTGAEDILQANAKLVSPAAPPEAPSYPPKALIAFLGVAGGMMLGCAIALLREGGDHTFRRADQIETHDRPAGAGHGAAGRRPHAAGHAGAAPADLDLQRVAAPPADRHRAVRSGRLAQDHPVQLGDAVGRQVGDGGLARPAAGQQRQARPADRLRLAQPAPAPDLPLRQSRRPGQPAGRQGRSCWTTSSITMRCPASTCMTAGTVEPALGAPARVRDRMRQPARGAGAALRVHHPAIPPPALVTADVLALSRLVEKVVFVVRWGHTRQDAVIEALKQIIDAQGDVAGVVMSRVVAKEYRQYAYRDPFYEYSRPIKASFG